MSLVGTGTNLLAISLWKKPEDLWTFCGITDSLQDGGLSSVRSSNNEHAELEIAGHLDIAPRQVGRGLTHPLITMVTRRRLVGELNTREIVGAGAWGLGTPRRKAGVTEPILYTHVGGRLYKHVQSTNTSWLQ
jgi:hypothetical protein